MNNEIKLLTKQSMFRHHDQMIRHTKIRRTRGTIPAHIEYKFLRAICYHIKHNELIMFYLSNSILQKRNNKSEQTGTPILNNELNFPDCIITLLSYSICFQPTQM